MTGAVFTTAALTISLHIPQHESREAHRVPANESPADVPQLGQSALKDIVLIDYLNEGQNRPTHREEKITIDTVKTAKDVERATRQESARAIVDMANQYDDVYVAPPPAIELPFFEEFVDIADCESELTWDINTGNGYYGGLQFSLESWAGAGGHAYAVRPDLATPYEQIITAHELEELQGFGAWPVCSEKLGYI